jgi:predicted glycoside hydrolase/deacetylase ChbG (UPF0249 family)
MEFEFSTFNRNKLFIAADDFGISPRANRNILYLMELGKIDRVAIMANGTIMPAEKDKLLRSGIKLDIHLDILHELDQDRKQRSGAFLRTLGFALKILSGKVSRKKVQADWESQIIRFKEVFGKYPDGMNSHEHVHFFPPFFKAMLQLQEKYAIPYVRFGDSIDLRHHTIVAHMMHWMHLINRGACWKNGCVSSNSFISLDWIDDMDAFLKTPPEGTVEIACHPENAEDFVKIKKYF